MIFSFALIFICFNFFYLRWFFLFALIFFYLRWIFLFALFFLFALIFLRWFFYLHWFFICVNFFVCVDYFIYVDFFCLRWFFSVLSQFFGCVTIIVCLRFFVVVCVILLLLCWALRATVGYGCVHTVSNRRWPIQPYTPAATYEDPTHALSVPFFMRMTAPDAWKVTAKDGVVFTVEDHTESESACVATTGLHVCAKWNRACRSRIAGSYHTKELIDRRMLVRLHARIHHGMRLKLIWLT